MLTLYWLPRHAGERLSIQDIALKGRKERVQLSFLFQSGDERRESGVTIAALRGAMVVAE